MKICCKCKIQKPLEQYNKKSSNKDGLERYCKECHKEKNKKHYQDNKRSYINNSLKNRDTNRTWLTDYKKMHGCVMCKESKHWRLAFHHVDPKTKSFNISKSYGNVSKVTLLEEINKCVLVCHNCHADIHYEERISR